MIELNVDRLESKLNSIENNLESLDSIISCKFVLDDIKEVRELHIVSNGKRNPKQLSRDVQSILIANHDLNIDYKKISIAEIPNLNIRKASPRLAIDKVAYETKENRIKITVGLKDSTGQYESTIEGANIGNNIDRMIAKATLKTIEKVYKLNDIFILEDLKTLHLSRNDLVIVIIACMLNNEYKTLCGSSLVEEDSKIAIVRSVLNATNRYISNQ